MKTRIKKILIISVVLFLGTLLTIFLLLSYKSFSTYIGPNLYYNHSPKGCQAWKGRGGYRQYKCPSFEISIKHLDGPPEIKHFVELKEPRGHGYIFYENKKKSKQSK